MADLDDRVNVGGCTGRITKLTESEVYVDGVYYYSPDGYKEPWTCVYNRVDFETLPRYGDGEWDASDLNGKWS